MTKFVLNIIFLWAFATQFWGVITSNITIFLGSKSREKKSVRFLSLAQIFGRHYSLDEFLPDNFRIKTETELLERMNSLHEECPDSYIVKPDPGFQVFSNGREITYGANGHSRWHVVKACTSEKREVYFLLLGVRKVWGVQLDLGMNLRKTVESSQGGREIVRSFISEALRIAFVGGVPGVTVEYYYRPKKVVLQQQV